MVSGMKGAYKQVNRTVLIKLAYFAEMSRAKPSNNLKIRLRNIAIYWLASA